eukprot:3940321-Rhodomonas_salina.7
MKVFETVQKRPRDDSSTEEAYAVLISGMLLPDLRYSRRVYITYECIIAGTIPYLPTHLLRDVRY